MSSPPRIAHLYVRAPNWVGDLVMATPMLEAALSDERFERVTIGLRRHLVPLLESGPAQEHVLALGKSSAEAGQVRALRPDAALLFSNSFGAAWRVWRARVPLRAGTSLGGRGFLLTHRVVPPSRGGRRVPIPTAHLHRDVAGLFGITVPSLRPRLHLSEGDRRRNEELLVRVGLATAEPYVLCAPGAAFGAAKLWPPAHFARALDLLHDRYGWRAVISGGPGEEAQMAAVRDACGHQAISLAEEKRGLAELKALVAGCRLLLVGDSGPRWYAAALGVPCVSVMGPNFPELTASSLEEARVVRVEGLPCSPCLQRVCPLGHHRCMRELEPERVLAAAEELLARQAG